MCLLRKTFAVVICWVFSLLLLLTTMQAQNRPSLVGSFPHEGSKDILCNAFISLKLSLPNGDLDFRSVNTDNIKLYPSDDPKEQIPIYLTLSNNLNSLILEPFGMLAANTSYTVEISDRVKDEKGKAFEPVTFRFETGEKAYRKLITMNRPFGDQPAVGEWTEVDVSGEDLATPFLREATPGAPPPKVEEEPKLLKPERSRQELLMLVLMLYGGAKTPPGFGPTVLKTPAAPDLPMAALRESRLDMDELIALAADTSEAEALPLVAAKAAEIKHEPEIMVDKKMEIQTKWLLADLDEIAVENDVLSMALPPLTVPSRIQKRKNLLSQSEFEKLLTAVNQDLIASDQAEQLAMRAEAEKATRIAEEAEIQKLKVESQAKWQKADLNTISVENEAVSMTLPALNFPSRINKRTNQPDQAEFEKLLAAANQDLIDAWQQEQLALGGEKREVGSESREAGGTEPNTKKEEPELNLAALLVEETVKDKEMAGKIVFPQTAIFVNEYVTVEFDLPRREFVSFVLRDIKGDVYRTEGGYVEAGPHRRAVTLEGIPPGAYEAVVETIHQKVVRKVTIFE